MTGAETTPDARHQTPGTVAPSATGWHFTPSQLLLYTYETAQDVSWASAGDRLRYVTTIGWRFTLVPRTVAEDRAELVATILSVKASHAGPGQPITVDSADNQGEDSPLLGHLLTLVNATFTITCDPRTGQVSSVTGGEEVAQRIAAKAPSSFGPGEASPLAEPAQKAYASASLTPLWSRLLAVPASGTRTITLGPPLGARIEEQWQDRTWTWTLPAGTTSPTVTLAVDPAPVTASLIALKGSGAIDAGSVPTGTRGALEYVLRFDALTQPVEQTHHLRWRLTCEAGHVAPASAPTR